MYISIFVIDDRRNTLCSGSFLGFLFATLDACCPCCPLGEWNKDKVWNVRSAKSRLLRTWAVRDWPQIVEVLHQTWGLTLRLEVERPGRLEMLFQCPSTSGRVHSPKNRRTRQSHVTLPSPNLVVQPQIVGGTGRSEVVKP